MSLIYKIKFLRREDYEAAWELHRQHEPLMEDTPYDQFVWTIQSREGLTFWKGDKMVGCTTFSDYVPGFTATIHCAWDPADRRGVNRRTLRAVFKFAFDDLNVERLTSYAVPSVTDRAAKFLEDLGFKVEGRLREFIHLPDGGRADAVLYGLLKRECRWF